MDGTAVTWLKNGAIKCNTCAEKYDFDGPRVLARTAARAKGWHIYEGATIGGVQQVTHLCPACVGTNRSKLPAAPVRLDADVPLWALEEEFNNE